jgi:hypothetical protein
LEQALAIAEREVHELTAKVSLLENTIAELNDYKAMSEMLRVTLDQSESNRSALQTKYNDAVKKFVVFSKQEELGLKDYHR